MAADRKITGNIRAWANGRPLDLGSRHRAGSTPVARSLSQLSGTELPFKSHKLEISGSTPGAAILSLSSSMVEQFLHTEKDGSSNLLSGTPA